jgi:acetyl esterase/lipase
VPSPEFAAATAALRRERPRDGAQAEDQLLEQLHADEEARVTLAAAPDGVAVQEVDAGGRRARWLAPDGAPETSAVLHLHGGGFAVGAVGAHVALAGHLAAAAGRRVLALDYRLAPEHPHPAALDDAEAAHAWLREQGLTAGIALSGESAGGGLAVALLLRLRDAGAALPLGAALLCPWVDLGAEAAWRRPGSDDGEAVLRRESLALAARLYSGPTPTDDPSVSPGRADLRGLPPLLVQPGGAELLRDDAVAFVERARVAGVEVELDEVPGMWHVFQSAVGEFPEAGAAVARAGAFLRARLRGG